MVVKLQKFGQYSSDLRKENENNTVFTSISLPANFSWGYSEVCSSISDNNLSYSQQAPLSVSILASSELIEGQLIEGQLIEGQLIEGQLIEGQSIEGQSIEGQPIEGQPIEEQSIEEQSKLEKDLAIEASAWASGFYQRSPKKITATGLMLGFWEMKKTNENSYNQWALYTGIETGAAVSKQAIADRMTPQATELGKKVLKKALDKKLTFKSSLSKNEQSLIGKHLSVYFKRVLLQDSTMQKLPANLSAQFPSSHSGNKQAATLRLQSIFEFISHRWIEFDIGAYTDNDQSKTSIILDFVEAGDLILRDLGYFTLAVLEKLIDKCFVVTKWDNRTHLFNEKGDKLNLVKFFRAKNQVDMPVLVGSKKRLPMRMVARKLPKHKAKKRIQAAKKDRNTKANHSKEYFQLLKWEIYLTNVPQEWLNAKQIAQAYALRWYVEILFKAWKSYFNFKTMLTKEKMTYERTLFTIYLLLIQFVYVLLDIFQYIEYKVFEYSEKLISICKYLSVVNAILGYIHRIYDLKQLDKFIPHFSNHATYDKRKKRTNMKQKILTFKELWET